jgi:hypothetical protein
MATNVMRCCISCRVTTGAACFISLGVFSAGGGWVVGVARKMYLSDGWVRRRGGMCKRLVSFLQVRLAF